MTITSGVGLISGINTASLINALIAVDSQPVTLLQNQNTLLQSQQVAYQSISAQLLSLKSDADTLTNAQTYQATTGTSSNSNASVSTTSAAQPGTYNLDVAQLVSAQQTITNGFASTGSLLGAGTLRFDFGPSQLSSDTSLSTLNGGSGVSRGEIRITDHSGASAIVDLSTAVTVNDVVNAINSTSGINVTASVQGDNLVLTDNTGLSTGALTVANVGSTNTATSLGLAGSTSTSTLTGSDINVVGSSTQLATLNDGNGVRTAQGQNDFSVTTASDATFNVSLGSGATLGDVVNSINNATGNGGAVTASLTQTGLKLTDNTTGSGSLTVAALNGSEAANDLGILGSGSGSITGSRLIADLNSKLIKNLGGGNLDLTLGTINVNGTSVDLSGAESVSDIISDINNSGAGVTAALNNAGDGLQPTTNNGSALTVSDTTGNAATTLKLAGTSSNGQIDTGDLDLKYISEATTLQSLNGGTGVADGSFTITDSAGATANINVSSTSDTTVGDVINQINASGLDVHAQINADGNGILLQDTGPGATALTVAEDGSTTAQDLGILGAASAPGQNLNGSFAKTVTVSATDTLQDVANNINAAGIGISASIIDDGSSTDPYRLSLQSTNSGQQGAFVFDDGGLNLGTTNLVNAQDAVVFYGSNNASNAIAITSSSNTLSNIIPGATVTLSGLGQATISISQNNSAIDTAVQSFVNDFNSVINTIGQYDTFNTTNNTAGLLLGDGTTQDVLSSLYQYINSTDPNVTSSVNSLAALGITVGTGGTLTFDQSTLDSALSTNRNDVIKLFTYKQTSTDPVTGDVVTSDAGLGVNIDTMLSNLTDPNTGLITEQVNTLTSQTNLNNNQINNLNTLLAAEKARLQSEFNNMESTLATLQSQGSALSSLSSLLDSGSSSSSSTSSTPSTTSSSSSTTA